MHHFTFWTWIYSRIYRACLYKALKDSDRQTNANLAQAIFFC